MPTNPKILIVKNVTREGQGLLEKIDQFLNFITMYRLVLYGLLVLAGVSIVFGFMKFISNQGVSLFISLAVLVATCLGSNFIFSKIFKAPTNVESSFITALILFFLFSPGSTPFEHGMTALAGLIAMASKYLLAIHKRHIFNPAAFAAVVFSFTNYSATWWVGSPVLLPFVLVLGFLIVRKIRRADLFFATIVSSLVFALFFGFLSHTSLQQVLIQHFLLWALIFFASVMVTEPFTTPPTKNLQIFYGLLVGALSSLPFHFGPLYSTPELALVIGNLFSYAVSLRRRLSLKLVQQQEVASDTLEFEFEVSPPLMFRPGQYLEWTLPHSKPDARGDRRYFTIASSPTEDRLKLGVKFANPSSSFKQKLRSLNKNETILAGQLGGDFILPRDKKQKLVFMAGGIGITPFRSIIKYLADSNERRDAVLFYSNRTPKEIAYKKLFDEAEKKIGMSTVYVITDKDVKDWQGETGYINEAMLKKHVPDYMDRMFYLSGPNSMVEAYKTMLKKLGVHGKNIMTDYFPGYV